MNCYFLILKVFWCVILSFGELLWSQQSSNTIIKSLSLTEGLSQSTVHSIVQDHNGFMWFATEDGLNKYDGYSFSVFKNDPLNKNSLSDNSLYALCEGRPGEMWIGTWSKGLDLYDNRYNRFTNFSHSERDSNSLSDNTVYALLLDTQGSLWIGTENGLNRLDTSSHKIKRYYNNPDDSLSISDNIIYTIMEDIHGNIWIGTAYGLNKYNPEYDNFSSISSNSANSFEVNAVLALAQDQHSTDYIWIGGLDGSLNKLHIENLRLERYGFGSSKNNEIKDDINTLMSDSLGNMWVGTNTSGIYVIDKNGNTVKELKYDVYYPPLISSNNMLRFYKSKSGIIWIGTSGGGVNLLSNATKKFKTYRNNSQDSNSISSDMIMSMTEDNNGLIWLSTWNTGICSFNPLSGQFVRYPLSDKNNGPSSNLVFWISKAKNGNLLLGTEDDGLNILNPDKKTFRYVSHNPSNKNSPASNSIISVMQDSKNDIWLGHYYDGLDRWNLQTNDFTHFEPDPMNPDALSGSKVYTMFEDSYGNLWFAIERKGIDKYIRSTNSFINFKHEPDNFESLSNNDVMTFFQDSKNRLWIGTYGGGFCQFDYETESFTNYTEKQGLPNNVVYAFLEDSQGRLWLSTNKGLSCFDPEKTSFRNYNINDGLQSNEFNSAYVKSSSGVMYFGGVNGFNSFLPDQIKDNTFIPPVHITDLQILNESVQPGNEVSDELILDKSIFYTNEIVLSNKHNVISFEFSALNYLSSSNNKYAYMLDGFDQEWNYTNRRFASYSNLPAGDYVFKVIGSNNDGYWNDIGDSLQITIRPAFWGTWWFIGLALISLVGLMSGAHLYRVSGVREKNLQLNKINKTLNTEIAQRKRYEDELLKSEERFKQIAQATFEGIVIHKAGHIIEVNHSACEMFGYNREEMIGMQASDLATEDYKKLIIDKIEKKDTNPYKAMGLRKDGSNFWGEIRSKQMLFEDQELRVTAITDITEKIKNQVHSNRLEGQLRQAQKMEAIGNLAGGVAHDFNNIVTIINGFAEFAMAKLKPENDAKSDLIQILAAGERASQLTRQLLAFSRKQVFKPEVLDINLLINNLEKMISRLIPADIIISKKLENRIPKIYADPGQIEQIIMNLVVNSRDAFIASETINKKIIIGTEKVLVDENFVANHLGISVGRYLRIFVSDNGIGMSEDIQQKIFEPFFTTKAEGKGTGLGLAMVYGMVKQNNACVYVESEPASGTTINIYWPFTEKQEDSNGNDFEQDIKLKGSEAILLVEDDAAVRNFAETSFKQYGYRVYSASNGLEALSILKKNTPINLLVTDLVMPEMNGSELIKQLNLKYPHIKQLVISGYSDDNLSSGGLLKEKTEFLQKPFKAKTLLKTVRDILDKN